MAVTVKNGSAEFGAPLYINPKLVPASAEDVFTNDVFLTLIHLSNKSAATVTVTITDKQSPSREVVPTVSIAANSDHLRVFPREEGGRFCPNGVSWVASDGAAVTGFIAARG